MNGETCTRTTIDVHAHMRALRGLDYPEGKRKCDTREALLPLMLIQVRGALGPATQQEHRLRSRAGPQPSARALSRELGIVGRLEK